MPLYEYKCGSCKEVFEVLQKFSDEPLSVHVSCGGPLERLISTSAFQFKGTGWYVTDYGKKSNGKSKDSGDSKPSTDSKPAVKTDTASSSSSSPSSSSASSGDAKPAASAKPSTKND